MNKFKKIMFGLFAAASVSCLCGAAACAKPKYYQLTFEGSGIDFVLQDNLAEFENGGTVKKGVEVRFTLSLGANTIGDPVITLSDGTTLTPDENGVYSFIMDRETKVTAGGLNGIYTLTLDKFESVLGTDGQYVRQELWITYLDEKGNELGDEVRLEGGSDFKFKLKVSPYYVQKCAVNCGYEVLEADANGVYTVENITSDSTISVSGLEQEKAFALYNNGERGKGTKDDPYQISRPIDLYYMAVLVNDAYYSGYDNSYYKLMNDIDMEGEKIFVIGDSTNTTALFMGTFDGNGKTISNFYITDEYIDQSSFEKGYLSDVGLFGNAVATTSRPVVIKDLTLKDYEIRVHPGESKMRSIVGSVVGSGIGVQINNCHAENGEIIAFSDDNQIVFMGGIAGYLQAAYSEDSASTITFDTSIRACSTDVNIEGTGSPRAAGGIAGYLVSTYKHAVAYVVNSYSKGNIYGAMHAGGIVGTLGRYSGVANCYSTSNVSASNTVSSSMVTSDYMVAYAGGIVGYADEDTVVSSCYASNGKLSANSVHGAAYEDTGSGKDGYGNDINGIAGHCAAAGVTSIDSASPVLYNNVVRKTNGTSAVFTETLGWIEGEWLFENDLPEINRNRITLNEERELKVKVKGGSGFEREYSYKQEDIRYPVHEWYRQEKLPEYEKNDDSGKTSWGYYFDEALTQKVPYGFVPASSETTLYVGFADYSEVAGRYYVNAATYSNGAYIELSETFDSDGNNLFFRNGGLTYSSVYTYNDKGEILLIDSALANLLYTSEEINGGYFTLKGVKTDEGFSLTGVGSVVDIENSTEQNTVTVAANLVFNVVKASDTFAYGEYLADNGATYVFNRGGTGVFTNARNERQSFTYTVSDTEADLVFDGGNGGAAATVEEGKIKKVSGVNVRLKDAFAGVWRTASNSDVRFEFSGFGNVKYFEGGNVKSANYDADGNFNIEGTPYSASIGADGLLEINDRKYYLADDFTGTWYGRYETERVEVTFEGIGRNGYGQATVSYVGNVVTSLDAQYDIFTDSYGTSVRLFVGDRNYGELAFDPDSGKATGIFYSMRTSAYNTAAEFSLYDNFRGTWVGNSAAIDTITFSGKSASGEAEVTITASDGGMVRGTYKLDGLTGCTVKAGDDTYVLNLDEFAERIVVAGGTTLARRDEWRGVTLYDENDVAYTFDGKGYVGGTVTIGSETKNYSVAGDTVKIDGKTLIPTDSGFTLGEGGAALKFKSGFVGDWLVSGTDYHLTIAEVDGHFKAKVNYSDPAVTGDYYFDYDPATGTLSYTEERNGARVITSLNLLGNNVLASNELTVRRSGGSDNLTRNCVRTGLVDEWKGIYSADDGSSWTFDGLGNCLYGSGTATLTAANGIKTSYGYKINVLGVPYMANSGIVFIEAPHGRYSLGGKKYDAVTTNALYGREVIVVVPQSDNLNYLFDGVSTLWRRDGDDYVEAYSYEILDNGKVKLTDLTSEKEYEGTIQRRGMFYYLTLAEI